MGHLQESAERLEEVTFDAFGEFRKLLLGQLKEMGRCPMSLECGIVVVLLVDEKAARIGLVAVHDVHCAPRLLTGRYGQFGENTGNLFLVPHLCHPGYCQDHHCTLRCIWLSALSFKRSAKTLIEPMTEMPGETNLPFLIEHSAFSTDS